MATSAVLLFEDEFVMRLFPILRKAWSLSGEPVSIGITGRNDKGVVFGVTNMHSGHRILRQYRNMRQESFQDFMQVVHRSYRGREIGLLLDNSSVHTALKSQQLAEELRIKLVWLPKQCAELNAMDHFWRQVKADISTNYQYRDIDEHVAFALNYMRYLTKTQALIRAGILSKNFWLKRYLQTKF